MNDERADHSWLAWPLPPKSVPRIEPGQYGSLLGKHAFLGDESKWKSSWMHDDDTATATSGRSEDAHERIVYEPPSTHLQEILVATMLRIAKEKFESREEATSSEDEDDESEEGDSSEEHSDEDEPDGNNSKGDELYMGTSENAHARMHVETADVKPATSTSASDGDSASSMEDSSMEGFQHDGLKRFSNVVDGNMQVNMDSTSSDDETSEEDSSGDDSSEDTSSKEDSSGDEGSVVPKVEQAETANGIEEESDSEDDLGEGLPRRPIVLPIHNKRKRSVSDEGRKVSKNQHIIDSWHQLIRDYMPPSAEGVDDDNDSHSSLDTYITFTSERSDMTPEPIAQEYTDPAYGPDAAIPDHRNPYLKPVITRDDEYAADMLTPTARHILSKFDNLLIHLQKQAEIMEDGIKVGKRLKAQAKTARCPPSWETITESALLTGFPKEVVERARVRMNMLLQDGLGTLGDAREGSVEL